MSLSVFSPPGIRFQNSTGRDKPEAAVDDVDESKAAYALADGILDAYHQFATSVLDRSENTLQLHTRYIEKLLDYVDKPPSRITQDEIAASPDSEDGVSDATRTNIIGALRVFFRYFLN